MKHWNSHNIAAAFADAAVDPSRWGNAMEVIARETGSYGAMLFSVGGALPNAPISESMRPGMEVYFRDGWHLRDERFRAVPAMIKHGVADDFDIIAPDDMMRHPYYQELLRPLGLRYFGMLKMAGGGESWGLPIQRTPEQGPFSKGEKRELADLSARLSTAAIVARALGFAAAHAASEALEVTGSAIAMLNRRGEVLRLNRAAEGLMDCKLRIVKKRLTSIDRRGTDALERALYALLWTATPTALLPPVVLPREARRPILAYPLRLSALSANIFSECQALLVLVDLEKRTRPPEESLRSTFGLTAAEARLAARLTSGAALESIADELRISKETARNELKAIFLKTDTHRQAELVALLAACLSK